MRLSAREGKGAKRPVCRLKYCKYEYEDLLGTWDLDTQRTCKESGKSLRYLFGSMIYMSAPVIKLNKDKSNSYSLGTGGKGGPNSTSVVKDSLVLKFKSAEKPTQTLTKKFKIIDSKNFVETRSYDGVKIYWKKVTVNSTVAFSKNKTHEIIFLE